MAEDTENITLQMLIDYQTLHKKVEAFLRERCDDLNGARKYFDRYDWQDDAPAEDFMGFEIFPGFIEVYFQDNLSDCDPETESYKLPLDVLFNEDFYKIMANKCKKLKEVKDALKESDTRNKELKTLEQLKRQYEGGD